MGKTVFVFSGQGAQYPGMGKELYESSPAAKAVYDMAESIRPGTIKQCFEGTKEELSVTINTQPCLFTVDLAAAAAVKEAGIEPDYISGFSLGEIAAVAFAGIMSYEEAFKLVCKRAELMDKAANENKGAMAAVLKLSTDKVEEICKKYNKAWPVNYNCPGQTVCAVSEEEIDAFCEEIKSEKGKAVRLAVSGAFHSPFMESASKGLAEYLEPLTLNEPIIPVYANLTAQPYSGNYKELLSKQVMNPVKWQTTVENLIAQGADTFIEVGVGKTLVGLVKKTNGDVTAVNVENKEGLDNIKSLVK